MNEFERQRNLTFRDAFDLLCGTKLGGGEYRDVFECRIDPKLIVKVEIENSYGWRSFNNVHEVNFWEYFGNVKSVAKWLAPIIYKSPDKRLIMQPRVERIPNDKLPKTLPEFLTDLKRENFGMLDDRIVCVDYAFHIIGAKTKLKKVEWT
jgi:hypothetical protein